MGGFLFSIEMDVCGYGGDFIQSPQTPHHPLLPLWSLYAPFYLYNTTSIKNSTRATVDHSAGGELITKLYVVTILKLLAVWESRVVSLIKFARSAP